MYYHYVYVFLLLCLYSYCYVFLLCLYIFIVMYYHYVYVFLLLCMFRSMYSVSLCCSVYCLCVNVYCTAATGFNPIAVNISYNFKWQLSLIRSDHWKLTFGLAERPCEKCHSIDQCGLFRQFGQYVDKVRRTSTAQFRSNIILIS